MNVESMTMGQAVSQGDEQLAAALGAAKARKTELRDAAVEEGEQDLVDLRASEAVSAGKTVVGEDGARWAGWPVG